MPGLRQAVPSHRQGPQPPRETLSVVARQARAALPANVASGARAARSRTHPGGSAIAVAMLSDWMTRAPPENIVVAATVHESVGAPTARGTADVAASVPHRRCAAIPHAAATAAVLVPPVPTAPPVPPPEPEPRAALGAAATTARPAALLLTAPLRQPLFESRLRPLRCRLAGKQRLLPSVLAVPSARHLQPRSRVAVRNSPPECAERRSTCARPAGTQEPTLPPPRSLGAATRSPSSGVAAATSDSRLTARPRRHGAPRRASSSRHRACQFQRPRPRLASAVTTTTQALAPAHTKAFATGGGVPSQHLPRRSERQMIAMDRPTGDETVISATRSAPTAAAGPPLVLTAPRKGSGEMRPTRCAARDRQEQRASFESPMRASTKQPRHRWLRSQLMQP